MSTIEWPQFVPQGWQCPVCKAVNAPHVSQCFCSVAQTSVANNSTEPLEKQVCDALCKLRALHGNEWPKYVWPAGQSEKGGAEG